MLVSRRMSPDYSVTHPTLHLFMLQVREMLTCRRLSGIGKGVLVTCPPPAEQEEH